MESQLTISPANFSASASDNAVLPAPVGPTMATSSGSRCSPCVAGISVTLPMNGAPEARDGEQQQQQRNEDEGQGLLALGSHGGILICRGLKETSRAKRGIPTGPSVSGS